MHKKIKTIFIKWLSNKKYDFILINYKIYKTILSWIPAATNSTILDILRIAISDIGFFKFSTGDEKLTTEEQFLVVSTSLLLIKGFFNFKFGWDCSCLNYN